MTVPRASNEIKLEVMQNRINKATREAEALSKKIRLYTHPEHFHIFILFRSQKSLDRLIRKRNVLDEEIKKLQAELYSLEKLNKALPLARTISIDLSF